MGKFSEDTLVSWHKPASDTEDTKINHAIDMIKSAISNSNEFDDLTYHVFIQGSYGNNTNVKSDSDVDVNVMLTSTVYCSYVDGKEDKDYGYSDGTITYDEYKNRVIRALENKFNKQDIELGNKSVKISSNSYRINADCVISFQYRDFKVINSTDANKYVEGIKYIAKDGSIVINYPQDHIKNGNVKNTQTNHKYKKLVRIFKRIRNKMCDENLIEKDRITSFLVECLVWNVPNTTITNSSTWNIVIKNSIVYLYNAINDDKCGNWGEVSERLYLFHNGRKWTKDNAKDFLLKMWNYMGYANESN